jgi:hypothetical protein
VRYRVEYLLGVPGAFSIKLDAVRGDSGATLNQVMFYLGQRGSFTAARIENAQLATVNIERLENPGQRDFIGREISVLDEISG